jgi:NAD(P)-dependent dehydrogenase (short-subunit alcohol dehydrogenase family)
LSQHLREIDVVDTKMIMRTAVVSGATGAVGSGIAYALLELGWRVHAIGRDENKLKELIDLASVTNRAHLHSHLQQTFEESEILRVRQDVPAISPRIHLAIASLGGWAQGLRLLEIDTVQWSDVMRSNLEAHWLCAKQWLPVIEQSKDSAYVLINGGAALDPVTGAGPVSIAAAAQLALKAALAKESFPNAPRVYTVLANTPVITRLRPHGSELWIDAADVGRGCVRCFEDSVGAKHGATLVLGNKVSGTPSETWLT